MKKLKVMMMTLMMCLVSMSVWGQEDSIKHININGFGYLKLGTHIDSIIKSKNYAGPIDFNNYVKYIHNDTTINKWVMALVDTNNIDTHYGSVDNRVKTYFIGYIQVSKYVKLTNVELRFFNDTLFFIKTEKCLNKILTLKYGEPITNVKKEKHTYINGYGREFIKEDLEIDYSWKTPKNILLSCKDNYKYNDEGKINHNEYTILYDGEVWLSTFNKVNNIKKIKEEEKKKIEQAKLFDF